MFGQPVTDVPQDLFIPPDALKVVLSSFQGPLDLLLYLIRKQNIDVLDIPMVKITEQYLHYIAQMEAYQFDLAAEYLLMAAMLIEIKSRLLLPRPEEVEDEEADPRAELVRRLLAYEQMKLAAQGLDALPRAGRDFAWAYLPLEIAVEAEQGATYVVVNFIALLELAKEGLVRIVQPENYGEIEISLKDGLEINEAEMLSDGLEADETDNENLNKEN